MGVAEMHETNRRNTVWTDERTKTLKRLWADGWSASQIARHLDCGMTRNAVIGKVHRLKLPTRKLVHWKGSSRGESRVRDKTVNTGRPKRLRATGLQEARKVSRKQGPILTPERRVEILSITPPNAVAFFDVKPSQCRYPIGSWNVPVDRRFFCGSPKQEGSSFCPDHHLVCWVPHRRQVREAA